MSCFYILIGLFAAATFGSGQTKTTYDIEAEKFIENASSQYFMFYNRIASERYSPLDDEDTEAVFSQYKIVREMAKELADLSKQASRFNLTKLTNPEIKMALVNFRKAGGLFVLDEHYFASFVENVDNLKQMAAYKEIEPYLDGLNMPDNDDSPLAYHPDIQQIFQRSNDPDEMQYYWEIWREKNAKWSSLNFEMIVEAFQEAAKILDIPVLELWYRCYDHNDFLKGLEKVMEEIKPLYRQFHAFVRQELYNKYGAEVISNTGPIPDHLFQQILEQAWTPGSVVEKYFAHNELPPYDQFVSHLDAKELIDEAERFYNSLGFEHLDDDFYKNQLKVKVESESSGDCRADIFDLTSKVFMNYCRKVDFRKFLQNHGYMGRVHYALEKRHLPAYFFDSYNLEYPVGEAAILSASTPRHLTLIGMAKDFNFTDQILLNRLLRMGIHTMFNIPQFFVQNKIMNDILIGDVDLDGMNRHYWKLMEEYAGVEPPSDRSVDSVDFPYSFYTDLEQNFQTKKLVSEVLGYQFYRAFCKKSNQSGPLHNCDFSGSATVGRELKEMMALGSSKPWKEVLAKVFPNNPQLSGDALLEYYIPVAEWLKNKNKETGAKIGWNASRKTVI